MKRSLLILFLLAFCFSACVHEDNGVNTTAYSGGSTNPAWPSDSARNSSISTGAGPTGLTKNPDTIPKGFTLPNLTDTSQKKNF